MGQSQNLRSHLSMGFGIQFNCSKLVLAVEHMCIQPPFVLFCSFTHYFKYVNLSDLLCYQENRHTLHSKIGTFSTSD